MNQANSLYRTTAFIAALMAVAFGVAAALSLAAVTPLVVGAALLLLIAAGLRIGRRWLAYIAFAIAITSGLMTYATMMHNHWLTMAILALSIILTLLLFIIIWKHPVVAGS